MAVLAIRQAIGSVSTPASWLNASWLGAMPFYQLHIRAGETTHLVTPSGGRKSRTFVQIPSISVHPGNPTNFADTNFFPMQSFQKQLVGFTGAGGVTDAKVPSWLLYSIIDTMKFQKLILKSFSQIQAIGNNHTFFGQN